MKIGSLKKDDPINAIVFSFAVHDENPPEATEECRGCRDIDIYLPYAMENVEGREFKTKKDEEDAYNDFTLNLRSLFLAPQRIARNGSQAQVLTLPAGVIKAIGQKMVEQYPKARSLTDQRGSFREHVGMVLRPGCKNNLVDCVREVEKRIQERQSNIEVEPINIKMLDLGDFTITFYYYSQEEQSRPARKRRGPTTPRGKGSAPSQLLPTAAGTRKSPRKPVKVDYKELDSDRD